MRATSGGCLRRAARVVIGIRYRLACQAEPGRNLKRQDTAPLTGAVLFFQALHGESMQLDAEFIFVQNRIALDD